MKKSLERFKKFETKKTQSEIEGGSNFWPCYYSCLDSGMLTSDGCLTACEFYSYGY